MEKGKELTNLHESSISKVEELDTESSNLTENVSETDNNVDAERDNEALIESYYMPTEEEIKESENITKDQDVSNIQKLMRDKINKWKEEKLHCGITGACGCGKSTFINAMRNLLSDEEGASPVGVKEAMLEPKSFKDPQNPNLLYWEIPSIGSPNLPQDDLYLEKIEFDRYDSFLILTDKLFTEADIWLAKRLQSRKKNFHFVRTKLDKDLKKERENCPTTYHEGNVEENIKTAIIERLGKEGFPNPTVYLISNLYKQLYDFPKLVNDLAASLPYHKKKAMNLSMHASSKEIILEKKNILKKNIYGLSTLSALGASVPVPGVSVAADIAIIMNEVKNYRKQFGLEEEELIKHNLSDDKINLIKKASTKEGLLHLLISSSATFAAEEATRGIPILGTLIASSLSFYSTYNLLSMLLNDMTEMSVELMERKFIRMVEEFEAAKDSNESVS